MKLRIDHEHCDLPPHGPKTLVSREKQLGSLSSSYPKSLEVMTNKFISPWVVVISLLRSGQLMSIAD